MEEIDKFRDAGRIASQALEYARTLIKKGAVIREVCDKIDQKIITLGALPAWPTQVGMNEVAAHWTPDHDDDRTFEDQLVSVDIGAHIDGYIGDNAFTIDLSGKYDHLVQAARDALEAAQKILRPGIPANQIGQAINDVMKSHNAVPVKNLSGHGISQWNIHDEPKIPNFDDGDEAELEPDQIIAIEPFSTDGLGIVDETEQANIFSLDNTRPVRSNFAREVMNFIAERYQNLPFAHRWLVAEFGLGKTNLALRELRKAGNLHAYPPLIERTKGKVAQFENTFYIGEDKAEILTKP